MKSLELSAVQLVQQSEILSKADRRTMDRT